MKVLVTGARGLLGSEFVTACAARGWSVVALGHEDLDVTIPEACEEVIGTERPDLVIHCAAWTAVDAAEADPDRAMLVNRDGTAHVATAAARAGARLLCISSDYVFDGEGERPWRPGDPTVPRSVYGRTKRAGELAALRASDEAGAPEPLVVRTGWLYGAGGPNFVGRMLERAGTGASLQVVDDQTGRPSWTRNVVRTSLDLVEAAASGVWHVADAGSTTWYGLVCEAVRIRGIEADVTPVSSEHWAAAAPRPRYSVLDLTKTEERLGRAMEPWEAALNRYLTERNEGMQ